MDGDDAQRLIAMQCSGRVILQLMAVGKSCGSTLLSPRAAARPPCCAWLPARAVRMPGASWPETGIDGVVLDRLAPGRGASGRNGGQDNAGLKLDPHQVEAQFGSTGARPVQAAWPPNWCLI